MNSLTPLHIKLLIHHTTSSGKFEPWSKTAENYLKHLEGMGAVELLPDCLTHYTATPLGKAWVKMLCDTPPPRIGFLDAESGFTDAEAEAWRHSSWNNKRIGDSGMSTELPYPPHTPPASPEGMKWEYRGMGWRWKHEAIFYFIKNDGEASAPRVDNPQGLKHHYFEAIPIEKENPFSHVPTPKAPEGMKWEYGGKGYVHGQGFYCFLNSDQTAWIRAINSGGTFEHTLKAVPILKGSGFTENPKEAAGRKKCPMHLLPPEFLIQTANVMGAGAAKYGAWNFRDTSVNLSTYLGAMMRHLTSIADGEDIDESGFPHAAHIAASAAIVLDAAKNGKLIDDRPKL